MNDPQLKSKIYRDAARVKKDTSILVGDSSAQFSRFENNLSQASDQVKGDLTSWVEDNVSQMNKELEKKADEARDTLIETASMVKNDVGHGLSQYNTEVQKVANKVSNGFGKKASRYPWVTVSIALVIGFLLGSLIKSFLSPSVRVGK
jgi:ElaB/YqjD/DUF883 family membrane-anchored ribosome-binding protein